MHPNIYGVQRIADLVTKRIVDVINKGKNENNSVLKTEKN